MNKLKLNLACGRTFVEGHGWANLDYAPANPRVRQVDLLARLPFENGSVDIVYSSHFLEHIPRNQVAGFLQECFRILKPGGVIRLVLPDFEEMCREYLSRRNSGEHEKAEFVVVEIIDQCVRLRGGGELQNAYQRIASNPIRNADMVEYVHYRNGETLGLDRIAEPIGVKEKAVTSSSLTNVLTTTIANKLPARISRRLKRAWFNWLIARLPSAFRAQNVSLATVGERHHWLWDIYQLSSALADCGYVSIEKCQAGSSKIPEFPFFPLDLNDQGQPRKGAESMYVEAVKSC